MVRATRASVAQTQGGKEILQNKEKSVGGVEEDRPIERQTNRQTEKRERERQRERENRERGRERP